MPIHVISYATYTCISPKEIFGKDADKILDVCQKLYDRHMYPAENGRPQNPAFTVGNIRLSNTPKGKRVMEAIIDWLNDHPIEKAQYESEKAKWNAESERLWKTLYGIAKRRHIRIEWLGGRDSCCFPDQFLVYKNGKCIALIQC